MRQIIISWIGYFVIRLLASTLRIHLKDDANLKNRTEGPIIWAVWHNRILIVPMIHFWFCNHRKATVLTSPSKDGNLLALFMKRFGTEATRGSSSRQGAKALRELVRKIQDGYDIGITPDGPRGPRYHLNPGLLLLAQISGVPIMPIHVEYSRCIQIGRWDGFMIPLPFSKVEVTTAEPVTVSKTATPEEFEQERLRIQDILKKPLKRL